MTARKDLGDLRIGISGWRYEPWRKVFYPEKLPQRLELNYASRQLSSIELNGSFYSLQTPTLYRRWYEDTPEDFVFSLKGSRFITHMKKLLDLEHTLPDFFASGVLCLEEKLGPILWQFPATMKCDIERFDKFFSMLPRDTVEAGKLARKHSARLKGRAAIRSERARPIRHAIEARSPDSERPEFLELLEKHGLACVVADSPGRFPYIEDVTADFMYLRLHGAEELYASGYTEPALERWAERIRAWRSGKEPADAVRKLPTAARKAKKRDVYVYFDNDAKVRAPFDAIALSNLLGQVPAAHEAQNRGAWGTRH